MTRKSWFGFGHHQSEESTASTERIVTPPESIISIDDIDDKSIEHATEKLDGVALDEQPSFALELRPMPDTNDEVLVTIRTPTKPHSNASHMPCDIVLVIDISGSMGREATVAVDATSDQERTGLTILDLVKHAARTILETLNDGDRLAVISFSQDAVIVQNLLSMNDKNKKDAWGRIDALRPQSSTNLWHGILAGMKMFDGALRSTSAPAIMVLTDGEPNYMCPKQGYIPKLRTYNIPVPLHTFGFGYMIRSGLLKSIAEIGNGNYAFIPDAGMIGTIFIHAIANLQNTFATSAVLTIEDTRGLAMTETVGEYIRKDDSAASDRAPNVLSIRLANLQYGQSRDLVLKTAPMYSNAPPPITASLTCQTLDSPYEPTTTSTVLSFTPAPLEEALYHRHRSALCAFLSSLAPIAPARSERAAIPITDLPTKQSEAAALIKAFRASNATSPQNLSLLSDLAGADPEGQVTLAISNREFFQRWGQHYLPSLMNAHMAQACNSFKDPGPLMYGVSAPLFVACRDRLDHAFDSLPAPKPSVGLNDRGGRGGMFAARAGVGMKVFNNRYGGCFAANSHVRLADGNKLRKAGDLRKGDLVWTPKGPKKVHDVLRTVVREHEMCVVKNGFAGDRRLLITPWHPVLSYDPKGLGRWVFPKEDGGRVVRWSGEIVSLLLERCDDVDAHSVEVEGVRVVTMGHGLSKERGEGDDVRYHEFWGNWESVRDSLEQAYRR